MHKGVFSIVLDLHVEMLDKIKPDNELAAAFFTSLQRLVDADITFQERESDDSDELKISKSSEGILSTKKVLGLWNKLQDLLMSHESRESCESDDDLILQGLFTLATAVVNRYPVICAPDQTHGDGSEKSIISELFTSCLFRFPDPQAVKQDQSSKCKSSKSRSLAFGLLEALASHSNDYSKEALSFISGLHFSDSVGEWNVSAEDGARRFFVGLKNQLNTCYMNSSLQQLFMVPGIAESLFKSPNEEDVPLSDSLLMQLKILFKYLSLSQQREFDALGFCLAFKDWEGNPVDVRVQQDVIEFVNQLFDKINDSFVKLSSKSIFKDRFGGLISYLLICQGCPHRYERDEHFMHISLAVKDKTDITESLRAFIEPEMLVGDNGYKCEECNKKVDAKRIACLKSLPPTIILQLKRFDFNFETMQRQKLNNYLSFPMMLDLKPYTIDAVNQSLEVPPETKSDAKDDDSPAIENPSVDSDCLYELVGVLVHRGGTESGHYYSFIKDRFPKSSTYNQWFSFDDSRIEAFDLNELPNAAFGGTEKIKVQASKYSLREEEIDMEKERNAYLLLYEKVGAGDCNLDEKECKEEEFFSEIEKSIWQSNLQISKRKLLFDKSYCEFVLNLCNSFSPTADGTYFHPDEIVQNVQFDSINLLSTQAFCLHIFDVVMRSYKPSKMLGLWITALCRYVSVDVPSACWLLWHVCSGNLLKDVFVECPLEDVRKSVKLLFLQACWALCPPELGTSSVSPDEEKKAPAIQDPAVFDTKVKDTFGDCKIDGKSLNSKLNQLKGIGAKNISQLEASGVSTIKQATEMSDLQINQVKLKFSPKEFETFNQRVCDAVELILFYEAEQIRKEKESHEDFKVDSLLVKVDLRCKGYIELFMTKLGHLISHLRRWKPKHACSELFDCVTVFASKGCQERRIIVASGVLASLIEIICPKPQDEEGKSQNIPPFDVALAITTLRMIIKGCLIKERSPMNVEGDLVDLPNDLLSLLSSEAFLGCLVRSETSKLDELSSLVALLCWENLDSSKSVFEVVIRQIAELDFDGFYPSLKIAHSLLNSIDSHNVGKVEFFMPMFIDVIQINQQFWKATDLLAHMLTRFIKSNANVQKWVSKNKSSLTWLVDWLKKYNTEPSKHAQYGPTKYKIDIPDPDKKQSVVDQARDNTIDLKRKKGDTLKDLQAVLSEPK
eukprot:TRINITY_DN19009_c0_g2_i1.p1 TRINITY_DN19009_c0_g2~~TRINITY_DN19009_c0_g2_i1.p1  ORF type:complete len:1252 (+),score=358.88 TRINITY_DN19009_c0_g2_i1:211-3756(+)